MIGKMHSQPSWFRIFCNPVRNFFCGLINFGITCFAATVVIIMESNFAICKLICSAAPNLVLNPFDHLDGQ
jgi:hypothetical protein